MVLLKLTQTLTKIGQEPPPTFRQEVVDHLREQGPAFAARLEGWIKSSKGHHEDTTSSSGTQGESNQFSDVPIG